MLCKLGKYEGFGKDCCPQGLNSARGSKLEDLE
jgi:hypothetical protein